MAKVQKLTVADRIAYGTGDTIRLDWLHRDGTDDVWVLYVGEWEYHFFTGKAALDAYKHPYSLATESAYVPSL